MVYRPVRKITGRPQAVLTATDGRRNSNSVTSTSTRPKAAFPVSTPRRMRANWEKSWKVLTVTSSP